MPNFSKFLPTGEDLVLVIEPATPPYHFYIWLILILADFFVLYPLWHLGRSGVWLWSLLLILFLLGLANHLLKRNTYYLLSSTKLWHVFYTTADKIRCRGAIPLVNISAIEAGEDKEIIIHTHSRDFYLYNVRNKQAVLAKLRDFILLKNDKSVII